VASAPLAGYDVRIIRNVTDINLRASPLTAADADQALYLRRLVDDRIDAALESQFNVLLGARRGAGATSLLYRVEGEQPDAVLVNAAEAASPWEVLQAIVVRAGVPRQLLGELMAPFERVDPLAAPRLMRDLRQALQKEGRHLTVLLDGPIEPGIAGELFGRLRDSTFSLPMTWIVLAYQDRTAEYVTPPADVFFETLDHIDDLDHDGALALLRRRGAGGLSGSDLIASKHDGTPRHVLALARSQQRQPTLDAMRDHAQATAGLTRGAAMLLAELQGRGPVTATDQEMMHRLGITDRQLRRNLSELEKALLVEVVPGARSGPGRPATTYALTPLGGFVQGVQIGDDDNEVGRT